MGESPDSRTAPFDRKRAHDASSLERRDHINSTESTPHKRMKDERFDIEHSKGNVLVSGDSSPNTGGLEHSQYSNPDDDRVEGAMEDRPEITRFDRVIKDSGTVPSVNWNSGTKTKIRTSLGRSAVNTARQGERLKVETNQKSKHLDSIEDQTHPNAKPLMDPSTPKSSPRIELVQPASLDHAADITIRTPISNEPTTPPVESKPLAPVSMTYKPSRAPLLSTYANSKIRQSHISLSSEESQEDGGSLTDLESDGGVVLNLQNDGQESGEISEANLKNSTASEKMMHDHTESDGEINESEENDATTKYFRPGQITNKTKILSDVLSKINAQSSKPPTLADLNSEELKFQLRYFHLSKNIDDIDRNSLVRCLVCAQEGHMAGFCSNLRCDICGTYKQHFTKQCPQTKRCAKCRERGHQEPNCHYKLRRLDQDEMTCDLCQRDGHNEDNCELLWRTSGRPWESNLADRKIRLECYECGRSGHLGNDCSTRRPRKWMGTSTWSLPGRERSPYESQRGISIKGRARQQNNVALDDSDDDRANFLHSKIPEPVRHGQIRIATQYIGENRPTTQSLSKNKSASWKPNDEHHQANSMSNSQNEGDGHGHQGRGFPRPRDQGQYNYRPDDRRSISPHYLARGSNSNTDRYRPPAYSGRGERNGRYHDKNQYGGSESYRPMPSAAQKAWSRHKL